MISTDEFLKELALIIRGEHPAWQGDRIANAELFCHRLGRDFDNAPALAQDISRNINDCAEEYGISPTGLEWAVNRIREALPR